MSGVDSQVVPPRVLETLAPAVDGLPCRARENPEPNRWQTAHQFYPGALPCPSSAHPTTGRTGVTLDHNARNDRDQEGSAAEGALHLLGIGRRSALRVREGDQATQRERGTDGISNRTTAKSPPKLRYRRRLYPSLPQDHPLSKGVQAGWSRRNSRTPRADDGSGPRPGNPCR